MLLIARIIFFLAAASSVSAAEDLRGTMYMVYPGDLTLYGMAHDVNNQNNNTLQVKVCWDDPSFSSNCDRAIAANTSSFPFSACDGSCQGFQYMPPPGTVGSVTPRDGKNHLMYVKVISQANPGAGDKPLEGSPWPFTYRNGTVGPMWDANLEASPARLTASQLALLANSQDPYSVGSGGNTVCTVNGTPIKDDGVVGYYVQRHHVPCANVYVVSVPVVQTTSQAMFYSAIVPTLQSMSSSLQAIAIGWVQPSAVGFTTGNYGQQSISAAVANAGLVLGSGCVDGGHAGMLGQGPINPYFNSVSKAPFTDYGLRPAMMLAGESCPTCTAGNNYSSAWLADVKTAKSVIDSAIAAVDTNPSGGNVYWSWTSDLGRSSTAVLVSPLVLGNALSPKVNAQVLGNQTAPFPLDVSSKNILLYDEGGPHWNYVGATFLPGAGIGFAVTSTSGWLPSDGNQTNAASWLSQGAVGAYGNAAEPCELFPYKHPDPALVIPNYTQGQTVIEALWKSVRLPWGGNFVGDPLASPFSLGPHTSGPTLVSINPPSSVQGAAVNVTLTGANFMGGASVHVSGSGVSVSNVVVVSATQITATLTVGAAAAGQYSVSVTTSAGTTGTVPFSVSASSTAPSLTSITPGTGAQGTPTNITLTGTGFRSGATVGVSGSGVTASNVVVVSATRITATLTINSNATAGAHGLSVSTTGGTSGAVPFTVNVNPALPHLTSATPSSVMQGGAVNVILAGTNFIPGARVGVGGSGVTASNVVVVSATQITATLTASSTAAAGPHNVSVATSGGMSGTVPFTVIASSNRPAVLSIAPNGGTQGAAVDVVLTGVNFAAGATVGISGVGIAVERVRQVSATQMTATLHIGISAAPGPYSVSVTTTAGTGNSSTFTVKGISSAPTLTSLNPSGGMRGTSIPVTVNGTNFTAQSGVRLSGDGASLSNVVVVSPTQITVTFKLSPTTAPGADTVNIVTGAGTSNGLPFAVN
ncbi:MAG: hypothetical protein JWO80_141 [Bryobacterales bacterium]|nr:hypothetical protein [Bryobacterales bacterium]